MRVVVGSVQIEGKEEQWVVWIAPFRQQGAVFYNANIGEGTVSYQGSPGIDKKTSRIIYLP